MATFRNISTDARLCAVGVPRRQWVEPDDLLDVNDNEDDIAAYEIQTEIWQRADSTAPVYASTAENEE